MKNCLKVLGLGAMLLLPGAFAREAERVLMIGNSYTFYNDLPNTLAALSKHTKHPLEVDSYTVGAMSLRGFLDSPQHAKARQLLESGEYDWVVLQDQSMTPAYKPDETLHSVHRWATLAKKHDTRVILFLTWAHATQEDGRMQLREDMQQKTSATYCRAAVENKLQVAPVGEAWARWYRKASNKPLHAQDASHPNALGTYLAACVLHGAISRKALKGIPGTLKLGRSGTLRVPGNTAAALQKTANTTLKNFTPQGLLEKQAGQDAALPTADEVKAALHHGMKVSELIELLGKPVLTLRQKGQVSHQFTLRGGVELCAYCTAQGIIRQVSLAAPGKMVEIIDLSKL